MCYHKNFSQNVLQQWKHSKYTYSTCMKCLCFKNFFLAPIRAPYKIFMQVQRGQVSPRSRMIIAWQLYFSNPCGFEFTQCMASWFFLPRSWITLDNLKFHAKILDFFSFLVKILDFVGFMRRPWKLILPRNLRKIKNLAGTPRSFHWKWEKKLRLFS